MGCNFYRVPGHESYSEIDRFVTSTQPLGGFERIAQNWDLTEKFKVHLCLWRASEAMEIRPTECVSDPKSPHFPGRANIRAIVLGLSTELRL